MQTLKFLVLILMASLGLSTEAAVKLTMYLHDTKTPVEMSVFDGMEITVAGNSLEFAGQDNTMTYVMEDIRRFEYADGKPGLVDNITEDNDVTLLPDGVMIGGTGSHTVRIHDASGRLTESWTSDGEQFVSTADRMPGVYFIEISTENNNVKLKILKR